MTKTWIDQFKPMEDKGFGVRDGQEKLGNAIIKTVGHGGILVGQAECGTGKSFSSSIPLIDAVKRIRAQIESSPRGEPGPIPFRAVISTETITLQQQLDEKDLPFLKGVYGGFSYHKLLGRSNYLCLNQTKENASGDLETERLFQKILKYRGNISSGELKDVSKAINEYLSPLVWSKLTGSSDYCATNDCAADECYGTLSREKAKQADIVVVNHKILAIHFEMISMTTFGMESDGMFGAVNTIIVDEAHKLEEVLAGHWEEKYNEWEVADHTNRIIAGMDIAVQHNKNNDYRAESKELADSLIAFLSTAKRFFSEVNKRYTNDWQGSETAFCEQRLTSPSPYLRSLMNEFETVGPALFETLIAKMEAYQKYLQKAVMNMVDEKVAGKFTKEVRKAITSAKFVSNMATILHKAMVSSDGVITHGDLVYGVIGEGWISKKTGEHGMTLKASPIDVSYRTAKIWSSAESVIFLSATLADLTEDSPENKFRYFKRSLGITMASEISVSSPFAAAEQQVVYITAKPHPPEENTFFSVEEVVDLVNASNGRALLLFTSRREIDLAQQELTKWKIAGKFPYTMYVQEKDVDKAKLVEDFKSDVNSVMLGLKSMFTGIDIPGESLSNVIICRFPMPRFSTECKMKIAYWRRAGFPNWYSREALTTFQQAAGRLIRTESCIGVVSIADQRVFDYGSNVFKTASIGVSALGSRVTHDIADIEKHLRS